MFVRMFDDSLLKEEALQWTAALACRLNFTRQTKEISARRQLHPDRVCLGVPRIFAGPAWLAKSHRTSPPPADAAGKPPAAEAKHAL